METTVYIVTHKPFLKPEDSVYVPIQVGKSRSKIDLGFVSDDIKDNIAEKNADYCELTALYWIWKNDNVSDYIGICHYRRYFSLKRLSRKKSDYLDSNEITQILSKNDIIVPKRNYWGKKTVEEMYDYGESKKDLEIIRSILKNQYPEYLCAYDYILKSHSAFYRNMIICNREKFNHYCKWIFGVLFSFEKEIKKSSINTSRKMGFISEFLLDVWVYKNNLKIYECRIVNSEDSVLEAMKGNIKNWYYRMIQ